ncbi:MAG: hypothetical protein Hyperionvirus5_28 [Hyperionvirus sp.]|uniref:BTB domain-containing protein n=1 Tax=Hyperionvirus sp. TaxID=2487770 RepID=A0A3G5A838_9VIRU|nr:MAG: hypothetical protein Hyperionvirus5_28 [Hyperionvirus sp.]
MALTIQSDDKTYDDGNELLLDHFRSSLGDTTVVASDGSLIVDSNILSMKSIYFRKMFLHEFAEKKEKRIHMTKYNLVILNAFFSNIYCGTGYYEALYKPDRPNLKEKFELLELFHSHLLDDFFEKMKILIKDDHATHMAEITQLCEIYPTISEDIHNFCVDRIIKLAEMRIGKIFVPCFDDLVPGKSARKFDDTEGYCCKHFKPLTASEISIRYPHLKQSYTKHHFKKDKGIITCIILNNLDKSDPSYDYYFKDNCCEHGIRADTTDFAALFKDIPGAMRDEVIAKLFANKSIS